MHFFEIGRGGTPHVPVAVHRISRLVLSEDDPTRLGNLPWRSFANKVSQMHFPKSTPGVLVGKWPWRYGRISRLVLSDDDPTRFGNCTQKKKMHFLGSGCGGTAAVPALCSQRMTLRAL